MTDQTKVLARRIGCIDALAFFVIWSSICFAFTSSLSSSYPIVLFLVVPASVFVGWRGAASVKQILANTATFQRAVIEGFVSGVAFVFAIWLWGTVSPAFAAGGVLYGLSPLSAEFWFAIAATLLPALIIGGALGAAHGVALIYFNRRLVKISRSLK